MRLLSNNRTPFTILLIGAAVILAAANILIVWPISIDTLAKNKDLIVALGSLVNVSVLVLGGIFSYYRFFKGRMFVTRAELNISVSVIPTARGMTNFHVVILRAKNIGTLPIWEPRPRLRFLEYSETASQETICDEWLPLRSDDEKAVVSVIDSQESASFVITYHISNSVHAVLYLASLHWRGGSVWKECTVVQNAMKKGS